MTRSAFPHCFSFQPFAPDRGGVVLTGLLTMLLMLPTAATAQFMAATTQFTGADSGDTLSAVAQVLDDPTDDRRERLRGPILEQVSFKKYTFSDASGQIRVEIEAEVFPEGEVMSETRIEIVGEVETAFMPQPEVDVEQLTILADDPR